MDASRTSIFFQSWIVFPLPVKHLHNVKNKNLILQKTSFIIVRKRELLEASPMSGFCLLPHYQTTDMYKLFQKYLLPLTSKGFSSNMRSVLF